MAKIRASKEGLEKFKQARNKKGWNQDADALLTKSRVSRSTVQRFEKGERIRQDNFVALYKAVGIDDWEAQVENNPLPQTNAIPEFSQNDSFSSVGGKAGREKLVKQLNDRELKLSSDEDATEDNPDVLVQRVRSHPYHNAKIQDQCGQLRILDVEWPVDIDNIYIDVNVLEKLQSNRFNNISDFQSGNLAIDNFDRLGLDRVQQ